MGGWNTLHTLVQYGDPVLNAPVRLVKYREQY